jgi:hypothetical protein
MIDDDKGTHVQLVSSGGSEYLILYQLPASAWNSFCEFEVGTNKSSGSAPQPSKFKSFSTENGVTLGMTIDSLMAIKGTKCSKSITGDSVILTYKLEEKDKNPNVRILERYNMPEYKASYYFIKSRLVKFIFGFPNP